MKTGTTLKAGARQNNNETLVKDPALKVKTHVRGGVFLKRSRAGALNVKSRVRAGLHFKY